MSNMVALPVDFSKTDRLLSGKGFYKINITVQYIKTTTLCNDRTIVIIDKTWYVCSSFLCYIIF